MHVIESSIVSLINLMESSIVEFLLLFIDDAKFLSSWRNNLFHNVDYPI